MTALGFADGVTILNMSNEPAQSPRRRPDYAGRAEESPLMLRLSAEEREALREKATLAEIPPRAGSDGPNLSEAVRRAIEAWQPRPRVAPPERPIPPGRRVTVEG